MDNSTPMVGPPTVTTRSNTTLYIIIFFICIIAVMTGVFYFRGKAATAKATRELEKIKADTTANMAAANAKATRELEKIRADTTAKMAAARSDFEKQQIQAEASEKTRTAQLIAAEKTRAAQLRAEFMGKEAVLDAKSKGKEAQLKALEAKVNADLAAAAKTVKNANELRAQATSEKNAAATRLQEAEAAKAKADASGKAIDKKLADEKVRLAAEANVKVAQADARAQTAAATAAAEASKALSMKRSLEQAAAEIKRVQAQSAIDVAKARGDAAAVARAQAATAAAARAAAEAKAKAAAAAAAAAAVARAVAAAAAKAKAAAAAAKAKAAAAKADGTCSGVCSNTIKSQNGEYKFVMQGDGNLVLYQGGAARWASNSNGKGTAPYRLVVQNDRNVVIYDRNNSATWASNSNVKAAAAPNPYAKSYMSKTPTNDWGGVGNNSIFLDRHRLNCGRGGIRRFRLMRPSSTTINYTYACVPGVNASQSGYKYTGSNDWGGGNMMFLDRHKVDCGKKPVSDFQLTRPAGNKIRYRYRCSNRNAAGNCRNTYTGWKSASNSTSYLASHDVKCKSREALTKFQLVNNGKSGGKKKIRYNYTCCAM